LAKACARSRERLLPNTSIRLDATEDAFLYRDVSAPFGKVERFLDAERGTTMKTGYVWEALYEAAVLETDNETLPMRIQTAKAAIDARLQEIHLDHRGTPEERQAIIDALNGLNALRGELEQRSHNTGSSNA
jgi:hypothetical protein